MKIRDGFVLREVAGCYVIMYLGGELEFNGMITLNETGAFIWKAIEQGLMRENIAQLLCEEYEVSQEQAVADTESFIEKMRGVNVIE